MSPRGSAIRRVRSSQKAIVSGYRQVRRIRVRHRPIFVAGAMGSGTSLLAESLGSRFQVAGVAYESALEISTRSFLHMRPVESHRSVADYERAIQPQSSWSVEEGRRWLQRLYRTNAERPLVDIVDKGPNVHLVRAGFLVDCFPEARFILVVRDPVANVEGFRRKWPTFGRAPLSESIDFYRRTHERFLELAESHGLDVAVVAYEDLVARYEGVLSELGERLSLPLAEAVASVKAHANSGGKGIRNVTGGRISVVQGANEPAYRDLDHDDVALIHGELGDLHSRLLAGRLSGQGRPTL